MKFKVQAPDDVAGGGGGSAAAGAGSGAAAGAGGAASGAGSGGGAAAGAGAAGAGGAGAGTTAGVGGAATGGNGSGAGAGTGTGTGAGAGNGAGTGAGAGAAAAGAGTGAGTGTDAGAGAGTGTQAPVWDADHWRSTWAGADDKKKAWAERRTDIKTALDSAYAADQRIAELSVAAKAALPKDATPEQITAYRKDNGIPETPAAYLDALPKEVTLSDTDKAIITPYLSALHELNLSPAHAAKLIAVRQAELNRQVEMRSTADDTLRGQTEDALRGDWGNNYRAEVNNIHGLLNGAPADVKKAFLEARTPDGNAFVGTPEAMRWLAQLARTVNPYSVPVGGDGGSLDQRGVDARITEIEGWMGAQKGSESYNRYYNDSKVQTEYRTLVDARENMKKRTAA